MDEAPATMQITDGRPVLRFERRFAHPRQTVWRAITDPAEMRHWFPAVLHAEQRVGAPIRFVFEDADPDEEALHEDGEILELDPLKVFSFSWDDSVLRFELLPDGPGCRLVFTHALGGSGTWGDRASAARQAAGWHGCLRALDARLDGRTESFEGTWWFALAEQYIEDFGLAEGTVTEGGDGYVVRFERDFVQSPEEVWGFLTEGDEPALGQAPPITFTHGYQTPGTVTALEPARVLEYTWLGGDGAPAGRVRYDLAVQDPIGCRMVVTQTVPADAADVVPVALAAGQVLLEVLFAAVHGDVRCPWPEERTEELRRGYAARLA
ncbi:SRPBCC family protein [Murinocardiopsis flavida]|nr:SRPBCC family protein [Murinocardiopsis flavida]